MPKAEIKVTELRLGMIVDGTKITSLEPCTQPDKVHVNKTMCYDYCATVVVTIASANSATRHAANIRNTAPISGFSNLVRIALKQEETQILQNIKKGTRT